MNEKGTVNNVIKREGATYNYVGQKVLRSTMELHGTTIRPLFRCCDFAIRMYPK